MNKSKSMFLVLGLAYIGIAIGSKLSYFEINSNILLGLSLSSLLISLGDLINNICGMFIIRNDFNYMLLIASEFLTKQIQEGTKPNTNIDVYNVRKNVDELATSKKALHPAEYKEKKVLKAFHDLTKVLFNIAITIFVVVPLVKQELDVIGISQLITLFAFASLCINVALTDQQADILWKRQNFEIDKQFIIENAFPGYLNEFYTRMQHVEVYQEAQKQKADNQNEDNHGDRSDKENTKTVNNPILQQIEQRER